MLAWPAGKTPVTIPDSITSIGNSAFGGINLTSISIPSSVTSIGGQVFATDQVTSITIGANVTLGNNSFLDGPASSGFETAYNNGGKLAGTYTWPNTSSTTWTRQ